MCYWRETIWVQSKALNNHYYWKQQCKSQYKCAAHFSGIQNTESTFNSTIIRVFGIPEHGKGKMNFVGGIVKSINKGEIVVCEFSIEVIEMVEFFQSKFSVSVWPIYNIKKLWENLLEKRELSQLKVFKTSDGSSLLRVIFLH